MSEAFEIVAAANALHEAALEFAKRKFASPHRDANAIALEIAAIEYAKANDRLHQELALATPKQIEVATT